MNNKKNKTVLCAAITTVCLCLTACAGGGSASSANSNNSGSSANVSAKGVKAMFTVSDISDTFRTNLAEAAKNAADKYGMQIEIVDAAGSSETQMNQIKEATDVDVILCVLCDSSTAQQMEVLAGDKPIIFLNSCPDEDYLEKDHYIYVGSNEEVAGELQAQYILDKFASKSELNIAILKGEKLHSATRGRTRANKAVLEASGKSINYVFDDYADWGSENAEEMLNVFFKTGQPIDAVICNNDNMALGAVEAVKKNGKSLSEVPVLGIDATSDGLASIAAGELECTVFQSAAGQGEAAVIAAAQIVGGKSITTLEGAEENGLYMWVPFELVTKDNYTQY